MTAPGGRGPLLITGAHRSGTTWVGVTLAAATGVAYLPEPFNLDHRSPGLCAARFPYWFMRITEDTSCEYRDDIAKMLRLDFSWHDAALASARSAKAFLRAVQVARTFGTARSHRSRPLVKDPIALFSAEWLADTFGMDVVVLIRHPAAFAASLIRLGWRFDFNNFLSQPSLMAGDLAPFASEIERAAHRPPSPVAEASLMWKSIYRTVDRYLSQRPDWVFVRHEDLSADPTRGFEALCESTGIAFTGAVADTLRHNSSADNPVDAPTGVAHSLLRDSRANATSWRRRLDPRDVAAIRASVEEVSSRFYTDADWSG
jgi:sulfotransferase family protein